MSRLLHLSAFALFSFVIAFPAVAEEAPLHSAVKPEPRAGGWMNRHNGFNERVAKGDVDLIFIGDSITQGWEGRGKVVWQESYGKRNAVNLGIGGDRTQHVLWRLDNGNIKGISPKLAVIMIGTNNAGSNTSAEIFDGNKAIVAKLQKELPEMNILILAVFPRGPDANNRHRKVNEGANAMISKLADGKKVHYLDIGKSFLQEDGVLTREIMPDLLHLSEQGYKIWADSIEASVKKLMSE
jgi:lysophospholipase L1-like esterase